MSPRRALDLATLAVAAPFIVVVLFAYDLRMHLALRFGGEPAFYRAVAATARVYLTIFRVVFRMRFEVEGAMPAAVGNAPFIVVANHQPPVDLLLGACVFMEDSPAYVARAGLDRWCPTVSVFLRGTGSLILKRGDREGNEARLHALGQRITERRRGAIIFPEGRKPWGDESIATFHRPGLRALLAGAPDAVVIPVVFEEIAKFLGRGGVLPTFGLTVRARILAPLARTPGGDEELMDRCEDRLHATVGARVSQVALSRDGRPVLHTLGRNDRGHAWT